MSCGQHQTCFYAYPLHHSSPGATRDEGAIDRGWAFRRAVAGKFTGPKGDGHNCAHLGLPCPRSLLGSLLKVRILSGFEVSELSWVYLYLQAQKLQVLWTSPIPEVPENNVRDRVSEHLWELSLGSDHLLREWGGPNDQCTLGAAHRRWQMWWKNEQEPYCMDI